MHHKARPLLLLLTVILTALFFGGDALQAQHHHGGACVSVEREALLTFKMGITNGNISLSSWHGNDCCCWRGVSCNNQTGHVIGLHLRTIIHHFYSNIYDACHDANALVGEISTSLLSLKHLEKIDLSINCLHGFKGHIPKFLGSMNNLRYLNLSGIPFTGRLLSQLGNLSKLQYLDLSQTYSYYNQDMYSTDISWLTKLPMLQYLSMSSINLSAIADWPLTLNMISSLRVISLSDCSLHSARQSLLYFNLTKLEKLDLSYNYLGKSDPCDWFRKARSLKYLILSGNRLSCQLSDALGNIKSLQVLDLSMNDINMTGNLKNLCSLEILNLSYNSMSNGLVEWFPQCKRNKLQEVYLKGNILTGTLPNFIGQITSLRVLDLSFNQLVGVIPPNIWNLTSLTNLYLYGNHLNGSLPANLGKLRYLIHLDLAYNEIIGPIPPEVMNLTSIVYFDISTNNLNGSLPTEIGYLPSLSDLYLNENNFSGRITKEHLAGLKSLKAISLSSNNLKVAVDLDWVPPFNLEYASFASCQMGPLFPGWLQRLGSTTYLDISSNGIKGEIPDWFSSTFSQATYLDMSHNQLSGSLPAHMYGMACTTLYLCSNMLNGSIPSLPINISVLNLSKNTFSETLPLNFEPSKLQILLLNSNRFTGYILKCICKLEQLLYLDLSNNILEGGIPQYSGIRNIQNLLLRNNRLSGEFPAILRNNTYLEFMDLSFNKFSGRLPAWIGQMAELRFLLLGHNRFSGNIPAQITNLYIQYLDLSFNNFSGAIPWGLSNLTCMAESKEDCKSISHNYNITRIGFVSLITTTLSVFTNGQQLIFGNTLEYFVSIDLSGNSLTGEIPKDITLLDELINLNLSSNQLSGNIHNKIGSMYSLESLDLSKNKLSGEIPTSLSNLSSLSYLNLSYNNLSGRIPSGRQLDTLNLSLAYIGNSGLCGPPLQNCSNIHDDLARRKQEFEPMNFYFGLMMGVVTGHWMVFCAMLFKRTWGIAYFRFFDKLFDTIHVFVVVNWARFTKKTT